MSRKVKEKINKFHIDSLNDMKVLNIQKQTP